MSLLSTAAAYALTYASYALTYSCTASASELGTSEDASTVSSSAGVSSSLVSASGVTVTSVPSASPLASCVVLHATNELLNARTNTTLNNTFFMISVLNLI